ncbi:uncharacterized protein P174DRAFT_420070 [Aspergillus novofumigatus IBT 16806]|uniref:Glycophorin A domain protein n=1 Tax=Aspergillus novofumigatus (strain IBT 16806) TaxID=1392255 RepID=A0A2I1CF11_ASPN1|nr:uncharacterized protein P174DRAFT_420070 [Aspergillus novofumigatus IBT 16806]PKX96209.1 hypothetical protein P174DRAFT_420070 [Aspergillus novofumigatus IBT 16806]
MTDGFAVRRNNTCLNTELDCGQTWGQWHNCCPMATYCGPGDYGNECWKARSGPKEKRCANSTVDLYFAVDFFYCDQDAKGFEVNSNGFVGCAPLDEVLPQGQTALSIIVSGSVASSSPTISSSTALSTASTSTATSLSASLSTSILSTTIQSTASTASTAPSPSPTAASTNTAAIAGGVAGGVVALAILAFVIWFMRTYRARSTRLNKRAVSPTEIQASYITQPKGFGWPQELAGQSYRPELDSQPLQPQPQELPARI